MKQASKRVCIFTTVHPPFDTRIFHKQAKTLVNAGYDVTLIVQHDKNEVVDGVKIIALPKPRNRFTRIFGLAWWAFRLALRERADIYHLHDPELLLVGVLLKLFTKGKAIYDVHEDYAKQILSKSYLPKVVRKGIAVLVNVVENFSARFFDVIITVTDDIFKNFPYHRKVISVKNFPIVSNFTDVRKNRDSKNNEAFNLIYIGSLAAIRGISEVVQALEFINPIKCIKLTLCGKFYPPDYEIKIKSLKGFRKVEYWGWVKPDKIPEFLKNADAGIVCLYPISNYLTALPVKLFEYMASGLPVIASRFPLWKKIVEGNKCGLTVNPLKPKEIARAIEYLMEHPVEAKKMGENGRKAVLEKYNWGTEEKKLLYVVQKCMVGNR